MAALPAPDPRPASPTTGPRSSWALAMPFGAVVLGAARRLLAAARQSPWLDEFHTLFHARREGLADLVHSLARDNHPPLSFAAAMASRGAFGESALALRLPSLLAGLATFVVAAVLARRLLAEGDPARRTAGWIAAALVAASSQALVSSSEARMYAFLGLALTGLAGSLARAERLGRLPWSTAPWLAAALLSHYYALHHLAVAAICVALVPSARRSLARVVANRRAAAVGLLTVALVAPWYATVFPEQLAHGLWAGGGAAGLRDLVESYPNAILRRLSLAPTPLAALCVLAYVALVLAAARGFRRARAEAPATAVVLAGQVVLLPLWAAVLSHVVARSGFAPNYLAASGLALCVLAAVSLARAKRSGAVLGLLLLPLLAHAALVARSPGAEDYVGAAREALRRARANVPIAPIEWQPDLFPRAQGFLWCFERLGGVPDGVQVVLHDGDYGLATALDAQERAGTELHGLVVVVRGLPQGDDLWRRLEERFGAPEVVRFGVVRLVAYGAARTIGDDAR